MCRQNVFPLRMPVREPIPSADGRTRVELPDSHWAHARDSALAILGWAAVVIGALMLLSHIGHIIVLLVFGALLAYILYPLVAYFERYIPRPVAMLLVYLLLVGVAGVLGYVVVRTAITQVELLIRSVKEMQASGADGQSPLASLLARVGVTPAQIAAAREQVSAQAERLATGILPVLKGVVSSAFDLVLVLILSIYLILDGRRADVWLRRNVPRSHKERADLVLSTLKRIVGGYVRGQLLLAFIIAVLVGGGMFLFRIPYAVLLGVMAFVMAFIPILGTFVSGAACVLLALSKGWVMALVVLGYFVLMHVIEGDILGPRIVGHALGLHPVVAILAVIGGAELFGIKGALFACPIVGFLQALLVAAWTEWKESHPEEFGPDALEEAEEVGEKEPTTGIRAPASEP